MLLRLFRSNGAPIIVLIPIFGLLLWLAPLLNASRIPLLSDQLTLPLYSSAFGFLFDVELVQKLFSFVLVMAIAFLLVRLNTRFIIINNRTYFPAIVYILLVSGVPDIQRLHPVLISTFVILFVIEKILDSYRYESLFYGFFTAAFMLGVGSLIYPFLIYFLITLWAGVILLRKFNWREWLFTFMGFSLPFLFAFSYYYVFFDDPLYLFEQFSVFYEKSFDFKGFSVPVYVFAGIVAFMTLLSSQFLMQAYSARKIISRRAYSLLLWLFLNTVAVFFVVDQASVELTFIAAIPLSFLLSNYWVFMKATFWGNLFLMILVGSALFNQISYYFF
ncbi:MAG TPA: hypothetical protein VHO90_12745 [Bacteroidales bacterium]|nr:hypothetical protein [Bacteroidales bacterium]